MSNLTTISEQDSKLIKVLQSSLYPGATDASVSLVMDYCRAAQLDPLQKPVHIVPMWDSKAQGMRDVIMPGVGLYRIQAARTGRFAGMTEPEFGPDVSATIGGLSITYPEWARVTVRRILDGGHIAEFTAIEFWLENYAVKGGKEKSIAPNAMWARRPKGQLGKCASAQALRLAFPEIGAQPTFEEMEGKEFDNVELEKVINPPRRQSGAEVAAAAAEVTDESDARMSMIADLECVARDEGLDAYAKLWATLTVPQRKIVGAAEHDRLKKLAGRVVEGESKEVQS